LNEIAEGAAVSRRGAKDGVAVAVRQEKKDEEEEDDEEEEEDDGVIDLGDDALAREILGAHDKKNRSAVAKKQKRKLSEKRKKTSVAHVLCETVEHVGTNDYCPLFCAIEALQLWRGGQKKWKKMRQSRSVRQGRRRAQQLNRGHKEHANEAEVHLPNIHL
jgi:hypothetical protein